MPSKIKTVVTYECSECDFSKEEEYSSQEMAQNVGSIFHRVDIYISNGCVCLELCDNCVNKPVKEFIDAYEAERDE